MGLWLLLGEVFLRFECVDGPGCRVKGAVLTGCFSAGCGTELDPRVSINALSGCNRPHTLTSTPCFLVYTSVAVLISWTDTSASPIIHHPSPTPIPIPQCQHQCKYQYIPIISHNSLPTFHLHTSSLLTPPTQQCKNAMHYQLTYHLHAPPPWFSSPAHPSPPTTLRRRQPLARLSRLFCLCAALR